MVAGYDRVVTALVVVILLLLLSRIQRSGRNKQKSGGMWEPPSPWASDGLMCDTETFYLSSYENNTETYLLSEMSLSPFIMS